MRSRNRDQIDQSFATKHGRRTRATLGGQEAFLTDLVAELPTRVRGANGAAEAEKTLYVWSLTAIRFLGGKMLISNLEAIPGRTIEKHLGVVQGSSVRAKHAGRDFMASIKNFFGGELKQYTELLNESRQHATSRIEEQARALGANAILNVRFSTSSIASGAAEIFVYGTAVVLEND